MAEATPSHLSRSSPQDIMLQVGWPEMGACNPVGAGDYCHLWPNSGHLLWSGTPLSGTCLCPQSALLPCALPSLHAERTISKLSSMSFRQTFWRTPAIASCAAHPIGCEHRENIPLRRLLNYATNQADASVEHMLQLLWGTWSIP